MHFSTSCQTSTAHDKTGQLISRRHGRTLHGITAQDSIAVHFLHHRTTAPPIHASTANHYTPAHSTSRRQTTFPFQRTPRRQFNPSQPNARRHSSAGQLSSRRQFTSNHYTPLLDATTLHRGTVHGKPTAIQSSTPQQVTFRPWQLMPFLGAKPSQSKACHFIPRCQYTSFHFTSRRLTP